MIPPPFFGPEGRWTWGDQEARLRRAERWGDEA